MAAVGWLPSARIAVAGFVGVALIVTVAGLALAAPQPEAIDRGTLAAFLVIGFAWITAGLIAWARRPGNRCGVLMTAVGFLWLLPGLSWDASLPVTVSFLTAILWVGPMAHLFVAFPDGRLTGFVERLVVIVIYVDVSVVNATAMTLQTPADLGCEGCPPSLILLHRDPALADAIEIAGSVIGLAAAITIVGLVVRRWRVETPPARRVLAPVVWTSVVAAALIGSFFLLTELRSNEDPGLLGLAATVAFALVPLSFLLGLARTRLHRSAIARLLVELGSSRTPGEVRAALARTLRDPSLELAFWLPNGQRYVDPDGRPFELPEPGRGRAVSILEGETGQVAALAYDPSLLEDPMLVDAAGAAARLALENARLHAELRAQLTEVQASRARIVQAGDAERRRIERDLHDGAQQRLLGIRFALRLARERSGEAAAKDVEALLAEADAELQATLEELRSLARGLEPPLLAEEGLTPALEALARRSAVPVEIAGLPAERLPRPIEAAAYFVASEAFANVAKHAHASKATLAVRRTDGSLLLEVIDDGVGGADPTGLGLSGLRDRVEALGGHMRVESQTGAGTRVSVELPCG